MVLFFSATGNSKYAAEMIADLTSDKAVNVFDYIKENKPGTFEDDKYVFVCPVYLSAPARHFEDFIKASTFPSNAKVWWVVTGAGTISGSSLFVSRTSKEKGFDYMGCHHVQMPQDYLMFFKTKEKEVNDEIMNKAIPVIEHVANKIKNDEKLDEQVVSDKEYKMDVFVRKLYYNHFMKAKKFKATDACVSCGMCAKVCPLGNITLVDGKPAWGDKCMHCTACINHCPKKAIEYGKKTVGRPRYTCKNYKKVNKGE